MLVEEKTMKSQKPLSCSHSRRYRAFDPGPGIRIAAMLVIATATCTSGALAATVPFEGLNVASHLGGAYETYAADVDSDGDIDILGAMRVIGAVLWWENIVDGGSYRATEGFAADVDGDGELDVLGASFHNDDFRWWENRGGQFALPTADVAPARAANGATVAVLEIDATRRGRSADQDVELATLELLLEHAGGTAFASAQADALLTELAIYRDDGSGAFEAGADSLEASA